MSVVANPIWSAGFESGQAFEKSQQSESEKFFAHLNNGEVHFRHSENRYGHLDYEVVITPKEEA